MILALTHVAVVIILAGFCLGLAISFAVRPQERKLAVVRPLALGLLFAALSSVCSGIVMTTKFLAERPPGSNIANPLFAGLSEALVLAVFGFAVLAVTWTLVAIGLRRQD